MCGGRGWACRAGSLKDVKNCERESLDVPAHAKMSCSRIVLTAPTPSRAAGGSVSRFADDVARQFADCHATTECRGTSAQRWEVLAPDPATEAVAPRPAKAMHRSARGANQVCSFGARKRGLMYRLL